ncbi:MAG TPA: N-acetylmuramic acid 6-phosphate etherase [Thermoanaerobaculia bacterium]|nr:N-acetylmuramic acid 6-phosphate etherase [Thermoanaerobaculia bacterium]
MTHDRLSSSLEIDRLGTEEIVSIIQSEDRTVADAVAASARPIAQAIDGIADRLGSGGRLFYVGAGTSGRLAMVDASEIPPTYGVSPDLVQVLMAGGKEAFFSAVEGAEDDDVGAVREIEARVKPEDAVVGVTASGTTPYTVAAVRKANMLGALTVGITSAPGSPLTREVDIPIVAETGPEVILGSTRMKSGTAQKLILNTISTGVMIRLGHVYSNLMIEMPATNIKLRSRAILMIQMAAGVDKPSAERAFDASGSNVKIATVIAKLGVGREEAENRLQDHRGNLREVLEK